MAGPVRVAVPATSANLGPGFDCLGIALDLFDELACEVTGQGIRVEIEGEGADDLPRDGRHLVVRAMTELFAEAGVQTPGLRLSCRNVIPHSRGLGSSSAAIVGGLLLARGLLSDGQQTFSTSDLLRIANAMEGHPDNVAPALLGGLVVAGHSDGEVWAHQARVSDQIDAVIFVPPGELSTHQARRLLPDQVPHQDAAANSGRAALLIAALTGATEHLYRGTEDFLHQDYRSEAMPVSVELVHHLRGEGLPAVISGAGPTVLCFTHTGDDVVPTLAEHVPDEWMIKRLAVGGPGGHLLS